MGFMLNKLGVLLGFLLVVSPLTAAEMAEEAVATETATAEAAPVASGAEQIATTVCAACHGADGNSAIPVNPKLAGQHADYLYKQLSDFKAGKRANAVMGGLVAGLSDDDMRGLAAYFAKSTPQLGQAQLNGAGSLGEKIYRGGVAESNVPACAACHGATGKGLPKRFPRVSGQHAEYTVQQMKTFRTDERANAGMMQAIAKKMTEAEMEAVADYIQGLR